MDRLFSIQNLAELLREHDDSLSKETATDSCSWLSYDDDDSDSSGSSTTTSTTNNNGGGGLFVSANVSQLLRQHFAGSEGDLQGLTSLANTVPTLTTPARRGSDSGCSNQMVYSVQTRSATSALGQSEPRPVDTLVAILQQHGITQRTVSADSFGPDYWVPHNTTGYTMELTTAIRAGDLETVAHLYEQQQATHNTNYLQCCNSYGESILHLQVRRGAACPELLHYLVDTCHLSLHVRCLGGRTVWHDACWTGRLNVPCITFLLKKCPELLWVPDQRGFTPLQYIPRDAWYDWNVFLYENSELLVQAATKLFGANDNK